VPFVEGGAVAPSYDIVVVGTGFGSLFFVHRALQRNPRLRILMLERGVVKDHDEQLRDLRNSDIPAASTFVNVDGKEWNFTVGYGGGTNCWYGQTPRILPSSFRTFSRFGVGRDWPISYDDLEPYYCDAEAIMQISGPEDLNALYPRSRPYPQPPHRFTTPDEAMKRAQPDRHFNIPTARARLATATRSACCDSARCNLCPVDAKFTANNGFRDLVAHPTLQILTGALVTHLIAQSGVVRKVRYRDAAGDHEVAGELVVLGANALHSPAILQASGLDTPLTGAGLTEQVGYNVEVFLDGMDNFDGSTITTGLNYTLADTADRRSRAPALIYFENRWPYGLRREFGRWRQSLPLTIVTEDLASDHKTVSVDGEGRPVVSYPGRSKYGQDGMEAALAALPKVLAPLPVEAIHHRGHRATESHLQCSLRMGRSKADSVVDAGQVHHDVRNLVVVGSAVFPTCPNENPSLTVAAMSLRAADLAVESRA
jgi:choline dehydrogenase-like flavoprotein